MADIFVSYTSVDRYRAKALAEALATQGWSVWWDRTIPPGRQFDEVIEEELAAADESGRSRETSASDSLGFVKATSRCDRRRSRSH